MVKILILEDNFSQAESLSNKLRDMGYDVIGPVSNGAKALKLFREQRPDLAILDIKVYGEIDGIEVGKVIFAERPIPIIYLTAYENEFDRAKPTHPAAFISKPYDFDDLDRMILLAINNFEAFRKNVLPEEQARESPNLSNLFFTSDCLWIKPGAGQAFAKVMLEEVLWFKADNVYLEIATGLEGTALKICLPMSRLRESLSQLNGAYERFVQVNRSYIVNYYCITRFTKETIWIDDNQELAVGKNYLPGLMEKLKGPTGST